MKKIFICLVMTAFAVAGTFANVQSSKIQNFPPASQLPLTFPPCDASIHCFPVRVSLNVGLVTVGTSFTLCCGHVGGGIGCYVTDRSLPADNPNTVSVSIKDLAAGANTKFDAKEGSIITVKESSSGVVDEQAYAIKTGDYRVLNSKGQLYVSFELIAVK